jgi:hypothetical protein
MKKRNFIPGLTLVVVLSFFSCASTIKLVNESEKPVESAEPTQFEGTWIGMVGTGRISAISQQEIQFKGNTYLIKLTPEGRESSWERGVFTYTDTAISFYMLESFNPYTIASFNRPYAWVSDIGKPGKAIRATVKYSFNAEGMILDKKQRTKTEASIRLPEEYVFFLNEYNFVNSHQINGDGILQIKKIDDVDLPIVGVPMLGSGYLPITQREPGVHKISFSRSGIVSYTDNGGTRTKTDYSGDFSTNFSPGVYRIFLLLENYELPKGLPPIPDRTGRIVITRTVIGESEEYYNYIDIPIN